VLSLLRRKRYVKQMIQVGDAFIQNGVNAPQVRRQYAQGLIDGCQGLADMGNMSAALCILNGIVAERSDQNEVNEARGLIGRVHKQRHVNAANDGAAAPIDELNLALTAYYEAYRGDPQRLTWHGVNVVALLARAERDGSSQLKFPNYRNLARTILKHLAGGAQHDVWGLATAAECHIALGEYDEATDLIKTYVRMPDVDAFELHSFLRQLKEVWQLRPDDERQGPILALLQSQLMQREGGHFQLTKSDVQLGPLTKLQRDGKLEKVFGDEGFKTFEWYRLGLSRCSSVARFETKTGRGMGTGFVVDGGDVHPSLRGRFLVLTNAHVISNDPNVQPALRPEQARVSFECWLNKPQHFEVARFVWSSPPGKLDATLVELTPTLKNCIGYGTWTAVAAQQKHVYLIGHPLGGTLSLSLHDNRFLAYRDPKLHYRTPSESGSSGSPVFDENWGFIGLHHAGSFRMPRIEGQPGTIEANEGISLEAIRAEFAASFQVSGGRAERVARKSSPRPTVQPEVASSAIARSPNRTRPTPGQCHMGNAPIVTYNSIMGLLGASTARVLGESAPAAEVDLAGAQTLVSRAAEESVADPSQRAALLAEFTSALADLEHESNAEGRNVLTTPPNRMASLLQSVLAEHARFDAGRILEFAFDKDDTKEALREVFDRAKKLKNHPQLHPRVTKPTAIPDNARVFVTSDFGTGLYGAPIIAATVAAANPRFDLLLHLGDIYYSGQEEEVENRFLNLWPTESGAISRNLNGNHDMYSGGFGYFDVCLPAFGQKASYFALQNKRWLLVCLDTAYKDNDLGKKQLAWLEETLKNAGERKLILFSHHPLFSNFKEQGEKLVMKLHDVLQSHQVAAWYWGHEHHCVIYKRHPIYKFYGRCLGHGGMPYRRDKAGAFPVDDDFAADLNPGNIQWRKCIGPLTPTAYYLDGPNPCIEEARTPRLHDPRVQARTRY